MNLHNAHWGKTIFWGIATAALYTAMFSNTELILHMANTTPDTCVVSNGAETLYLHKVNAAACAAKGGQLQSGIWWHVVVPILIAFAVSFVHGAFTGLFWDVMGLKPASRPDGHK